MNILYLINHAGKGGSEKYVKSMAEYAAAIGNNIFFSYNEDGPLVSVMDVISKDIFRLEMKSPLDFKSAKTVANYCKTNKIDLIHTQFARENYIAILSKKLYGNKAALIHTCHINTYNNLLRQIMNKIFMGANNKIIAVCTSMYRLLISNGYPADKVQLVYNGIHYREDFEKPETRAKPFTFITLARLSEEKGIFFLLESAKELSQKGKAFNLVIAGDGPLYEDAKEFINKNKLSEIIFLPGYCDNAKELLLNANCFINSSSSEALSFAILEAMESGLPIIATNVGGNPDIVNDKNGNGLLVSFSNSKQMADAMAYMMDNPEDAQRFGRNARAAIKEIFNIDNSIKTTYNIYEEVAKATGGGTCNAH